jgi:tetratricopeptide (TPR) repeat protein
VSADGPAVQLFLRRAAHGRPGFTPDASERSAILNLCQRLDGLPLAIELAAAQVQVLSPSGLLTLFEGVGLRALADGSRDGPERFATMNAAIDWSWQRLNPFDQQLLRCASIFAGGFTGEAVGAVLAEVYALDQALATLDAAAAIPRLLRANLLRVQPPRPYDDAPRFVMLEPIRLFAADHLRAAGEFERTSAAHARWIEGRLHDLDMAMTGPQPSPWLDRVEREYPNARAAIDRAIAAGDAEIASTLIGYVAQIWQYRDHRDEAMGRIDRVLVLPDLAPEAEAMLCFIGADVAYRVRDLDRMRVLSERLLALSLEQGLKIGHAGALLHLSMLAPDEPDRASAIALIREAQAVIAPDIDWTRPFLHGWAALRLGIELHRAGELPGARAELERAAARQAGKPGQVALAGALGHLGLALADLGEPRAAAQAIAADIPSAAALGDRWMVLHLGWWLLAVTLPHAGDKRAKKACASLLASLEAEARGLAEIMSPAEEAAIAPYRERLPVPPAVPLPLTEAVVAVMDLAATLPERAAPQGSGRLELPSLI